MKSKSRALASLTAATTTFWRDAAREPWYQLLELQLAAGKEIGHSISSEIDERTRDGLAGSFPGKVQLQVDNKHQPIKRSMGDFWFYEEDRYIPVNVKSGITMDGSPNITALNKLITAVGQNEIDAYFLLIIKFSKQPNQPIIPHIHAVDLFDCLDYVSFDCGPGQLMLREKAFYEAYRQKSIQPHEHGQRELLDKLLEIYDDGYRRILESRALTKTLFR